MKNNKGQFIAEFTLVGMLIMFPLLTGGIAWYCLEMNRAQCAYQGFSIARKRLLRENRTIDLVQTCESIHERIHLSPLEDLDHNKGGLGVSDLSKEVSQASEDASRFSRRLQALGSTATSKPSGP